MNEAGRALRAHLTVQPAHAGGQGLAAGAAAGWGFQLQSAPVVAGLPATATSQMPHHTQVLPK